MNIERRLVPRHGGMNAFESSAPGIVSAQPPLIRFPEHQSVFSSRAARFRHLSQAGSPIAGYLALMGDVAEAQHNRAAILADLQLEDGTDPLPPLDVTFWRPTPCWRATLRNIANRLVSADRGLAQPLAAIHQASDSQLDAWALTLIAGDLEGLDAAIAPFVAAALQVHWTAAASRLETGRLAAGHLGSNCPVCGYLPAASMLQTGGAVQGLRYLVCGLCASQWNRPRIHCIHCGSSEHVAYFGIDGGSEAVKAEACGGCMTYVKLMDREKDSRLDPFADDLATLPLDLLMAEEGYQRLGFNPLLIPG